MGDAGSRCNLVIRIRMILKKKGGGNKVVNCCSNSCSKFKKWKKFKKFIKKTYIYTSKVSLMGSTKKHPHFSCQQIGVVPLPAFIYFPLVSHFLFKMIKHILSQLYVPINCLLE